MSEPIMRIRTEVSIDDLSVVLAPDHDIADLRRRIEDAVRAEGGFVDIPVSGHREVSVLITPRTRATILTSVVPVERGGGDPPSPRMLPFDLL